MLQIKKLNLTHKKDLRIILNDFNLVLNDGDKAVIIGEAVSYTHLTLPTNREV